MKRKEGKRLSRGTAWHSTILKIKNFQTQLLEIQRVQNKEDLAQKAKGSNLGASWDFSLRNLHKKIYHPSCNLYTHINHVINGCIGWLYIYIWGMQHDLNYSKIRRGGGKL